MRGPNLSLFLAMILGLIAREVQAQASAPTALPNGGFASSATNGGNVINDAGQIVGYGVPGGLPVPVLWASPTSAPAPLPVGAFTGQQFAARGINNSGQIIGEFGSGFGQTPIYWSSPTSGPTVLSSGSFFGVSPIGINNLGQIVGSPVFDPAALFWSSPAATPVALPNGAFQPPISASGINDVGQIVGYGTPSGGGSFVPILWPTPTSNPIALPTGGLALPMSANGINNAGQIVGQSNNYGAALFWQSPTSAPSALPVGSFTTPIAAMGINSAGQIAGFGLSAGSQVALLWTLPTVSGLRASVTALVTSGQLSPSYGSLLKQILDSVSLRILQGRPAAAILLLNSFNNYVSKFVLSGALTSGNGNSLLLQSTSIQASLSLP